MQQMSLVCHLISAKEFNFVENNTTNDLFGQFRDSLLVELRGNYWACLSKMSSSTVTVILQDEFPAF